jgi:hypothetical protein
MNSSNVFKSHPLHASHGIIHILFINNEKQTIIIIKVMAQSYANISNDVLLDLEKRLNLYVKERHLITVQFLKKCLLKICKMLKFFMNF